MPSIAQIVPGKIDWSLSVRVIRLWIVPEFKNPSNPNTLEMILLDKKVFDHSDFLSLLWSSYFLFFS